jgi:hypothetical protein
MPHRIMEKDFVKCASGKIKLAGMSGAADRDEASHVT